MRIALDATYSLGDALSGVGVYSCHIAEGMARAHPEASFLYCYRPHRFLRAFRHEIPRNTRRRLLWEPLGVPRADLFHGLNQRLPHVPLRRAVATFHDLFVMTGDYSTPEFRRRFTEQARDAAARSDRIIAVSEFTARQVIERLGVEPERVAVIHHGIRLQGARTARTRENMVLHVGAIQRRKNLLRLIEAFEQLGDEWFLVLAGSAGFGAGEILARVEASPRRSRIRITGYVDDRELEQLYSRALIFAFPSLDEGFGMPVLEAMAAGVPVLASNRAALPEVVGDAALLVNPESQEDLNASLLRLSLDKELREELITRGVRRAKNFSWLRAAERTWNVYQTLA